MLKREKEVIQYQLDNEKEVIAALEREYEKALWHINQRIRMYQADEQTLSRIHHINYQKELRRQVEAILERLHSGEYETINQYLTDTYTDAFVGTMYSLAGQGVPVIAPLDRNAMVKAVLTDSKISEGLYTSLGVDTKKLKKAISSEISRGLSSGMAYADIARNIATVTGAPKSRAKSIVRTEGHRIQQASTQDAAMASKARGADVKKQWDSTLDGGTRDTHRRLDGQIREVEEPFSMDGKTAMHPGDFGDPAEDCECRCVELIRATKALDASELERLKERAKFFELDKTEDFEDFKKKYLKAAETVEKSGKSGIIKVKNSDLPNGLPLRGKPNSRVDKTDDSGETLQRRVYDDEGLAKVDYDVSDHGLPKAHPMGAHKHAFDHTKKRARGKPDMLTKEELEQNSDIIIKGVNYHDKK